MAATVYIIIMIVYMLIGWLSFEWAWSKMKPVMEHNEERDSKYPAFRRWDVSKW